MARKEPKVTVKQNIWGNWKGYIGGRMVREFGGTVHTVDAVGTVDEVSARVRKILGR